ncbi:hypothetical protein BDW74DRAFT_179251 [Aspergillus multicolor]|uniref:uncharacterized protein n=1 Tax=Aspergillus multicolor TaxID=41759 RepID=UPI003CCD529C
MPFTPLPYELAETIRSLKSQYCRHADTNNIPAWKRLFFPSVTARFCAPDGSILIENGTSYFFSNRDQLVNHFAVAFAQQQAIHVVGSGELEYVTKEDGSINEKQVKAVWSSLDMSDAESQTTIKEHGLPDTCMPEFSEECGNDGHYSSLDAVSSFELESFKLPVISYEKIALDILTNTSAWRKTSWLRP